MKKLNIILFVSLALISVANAQDYDKFKLGLGAGYAGGKGAEGISAGGGILLTLEPAYRVSDNLAVGLRLEAAADPADIPLPPATITVFSSDVQKKQIAAGQTRIFTIEFEKDYTGDTPNQYQFTITFEGGETLSWNMP